MLATWMLNNSHELVQFDSRVLINSASLLSIFLIYHTDEIRSEHRLSYLGTSNQAIDLLILFQNVQFSSE